MANLRGLICLMLALLLPCIASAAFPPSYQWSFGSSSGSASTFEGACAAGVAQVQANQPSCTYYGQPCTWSQVVDGGVCYALRNGNTSYRIDIGQGCPANSVAVPGGGCSCNTGFVEVGGQCKPKKDDKCGHLEGKGLGLERMEINVGVASNASLGRMIGNPGNACFPGGCTVSGTVSGCLHGLSSGAVCFINSPSFTGEACDDSEKPGNCPAGTTPSEYAAGVCIPDKNNCATGSSPSKYAAGVCIPDENPCGPGQSPSKYATGVCLPNEDPDSTGSGEDGKPNNCPTGRCPSAYVKGLCIPCDSATDSNGSTVCSGGMCTITRPDGTTEEKPKETFCAENPDSPLCVKGEFSGTCQASFTCKGDAVMCAIAQDQHKRACQFFEEKTPESELYKVESQKAMDRDVTASLPGNRTVDVSGTLSDANLLGAPVCVSDLSVQVWGVDVTLPISRICPAAGYLGWVLVAVASLIGFRIISGANRD